MTSTRSWLEIDNDITIKLFMVFTENILRDIYLSTCLVVWGVRWLSPKSHRMVAEGQIGTCYINLWAWFCQMWMGKWLKSLTFEWLRPDCVGRKRRWYIRVNSYSFFLTAWLAPQSTVSKARRDSSVPALLWLPSLMILWAATSLDQNWSIVMAWAPKVAISKGTQIKVVLWIYLIWAYLLNVWKLLDLIQ